MEEKTIKKSGNKCGHDKNSPRFYDRKGRNAYWIVKNAYDNLRKWYNEPTKYLENLRFARDKDSQQRSEAREAISAFAQAALYHIDLLTFKIVKFTKKKGKVDMTVQQIGKEAGLDERRATRAFAALREAGYIKVEYKSVFDKETGKWIHEPAIKTFTRKFFYHLGILNQKIEQAICNIYKKGKTYLSDAQKLSAAKAKSKCLELVKRIKARDKERAAQRRTEKARTLQEVLAGVKKTFA